MNDPMPAAPRELPLVQILRDYFSPRALATLLGPKAGSLPPVVWERALRSPALDFVQRQGKEFRAGLVQQSYDMAGGRGTCPLQLTQIVELLHAGSLIVDDIQDQSTSRRGGPALHCTHGVPVALNVGNWMYFLALALVDGLDLEPKLHVELYRSVHGVLLRCHHGQALDLSSTVAETPQDRMPQVVEATSELKTGALMELAALIGAVAARGNQEVTGALSEFGRCVGVILQMLDDASGLLSERRCHKGHEDLVLGRPTWPWAWLARDLSSQRYAGLCEQSAKVVRGDQHPELLARALRAELRGSARVRVRRYVHQVCERLEAAVGPSPSVATARQQLHRMEKSYG